MKVSAWRPRRKNEAPVPLTFPGDFFVLRWDRDVERFFLELDDEDESSYDLGHDPLYVVHLLSIRGFERFSREDAVDRAREFGACQCIPETTPVDALPVEGRPLRLIQLPPRPPTKKPAPVFQEKNDGWLPALY